MYILRSLLALGPDQSIKIGLDAQMLRGSEDHTIVGSLKRLAGLISGNMFGVHNEGTFITAPITENEEGMLGLKVRYHLPVNLHLVH
jgi:hypothetical protein